MKKLLIVLFAVGLALGASAQKVIRGGSYHRPPRVIVTPGIGFGFGYGYGMGMMSPFYRPYYDPFYYPYGGNARNRPSRLDREIQDIQADYADRIESVRLNRELSGKERRQLIRSLKAERDQRVLDTRKNYYYKRSGQDRPERPSEKPADANDDSQG
ncbi:MAG: hypothetical protein P0Y53_13070 [Candidatus Pseudobacter hemicellulosilyticus]|uniref:Spy/CpxP family protein refolding chaperone n=1 Tax=Candidatus Pseudobacter hemicellulosilyticus TaxID=3121375 RepID=A0AAJ5WK84_9BACT|nr:MAG: hypothetical protein P0Y53_13070 [Pseudobacter sp.]